MKKILLLTLLGFVSLQASQSGGSRPTLNGLVDLPNLASATLLGIQREDTPSLTNRFDLLQQGENFF